MLKSTIICHLTCLSCKVKIELSRNFVMTFFPDPLRPSEGREDDKYRVNPIEADKKKNSPGGWELPGEEFKRPKAYAAFLVFCQKLLNAFGKEEEGGIEAMSEDALTGDVQELKQLLQILTQVDNSENGQFCAQFSANWHRLLQGIHVLSYTKRKALVDAVKLKALLTDMNNYPPNEDHKLGYYLSEFAGEGWLPVPFRDILKSLFTDHRINQSHSTLMQWLELINDILQS